MNQKPTKLFVIIDPESTHQVALVKALLIAKLGNCQIHAFMCVYADIKAHPEASSRKGLKHHTLEDAEARLKELMKPCDTCGVPFTTELLWNKRWYEMALHSVARSGCDLVIKSSFHHSRAKRFFSKTSDYTLMRFCACPILFTHQSQEWRSDKILACVDLESDNPQHKRLNNVIIRNARAVAEIIGMDLYIASVFEKAIDETRFPIKSDASHEIGKELAKLYGVDADRIYLRQGAVAETLVDICKEIDPSILLIGTIARTGIRGKLIGNTAEKLLDTVDADVLTVN
jgi:universal stress protein E